MSDPKKTPKQKPEPTKATTEPKKPEPAPKKAAAKAKVDTAKPEPKPKNKPPKFDDDSRIEVLSKEHPYRGKRAEMFALLTNGATVAHVRERHSKKANLTHQSVNFILMDAAEKGLIKIEAAERIHADKASK